MPETIDISIYETESLANSYGLEPLIVATAEIQQTLLDAFAQRDHDPTLQNYDIRVSFYGYGDQHSFLVNPSTENPYKALDEWIQIVQQSSGQRKRGKYGRYLAEVERVFDGAVLNDDLLETFDGVGMEDDS